ncbi:putative C-S lyase [Aliikangiella coralliicola]|uniref:cysteine-S-conjugate beta-lyase n=2 Tax=Aliikangiella coralliicola TaxID=2592383 RepID=A0A545UDY1_9GAMM|nr:putative C-S lyase [Aliikangiella coralliicola]
MLKSIFGATELEPYWVADMDFEVAEPIINELKRLAIRGRFAYEFDSQSVYSAIVNWYQRRHDISLQKELFVQVPGVLTGIALLIRELTEPGDGVLIQTPVYHQFKRLITTADRNVIRSPLKIEDGKYQMDYEDLANQFASGNVKSMILCNPHNPVGRVWSKSELDKLVELANAHDISIISDEIHSDIIYSGHQFNSIASYTEGNHVSLIGSPAKTFGMQSISNGYIYSQNKELFERVKAVVDSMYLGHGNAMTTYATIAAFSKGDQWLDSLLEYLQTTLSWIQSFIEKEIPLVEMFPVEGTYQIWLDFSKTGRTPEEVKAALLEAKIGLTPGNWFDAEHENFFRMNIASPLAKIQENFRRLKLN